MFLPNWLGKYSQFIKVILEIANENNEVRENEYFIKVSIVYLENSRVWDSFTIFGINGDILSKCPYYEIKNIFNYLMIDNPREIIDKYLYPIMPYGKNCGLSHYCKKDLKILYVSTFRPYSLKDAVFNNNLKWTKAILNDYNINKKKINTIIFKEIFYYNFNDRYMNFIYNTDINVCKELIIYINKNYNKKEIDNIGLNNENFSCLYYENKFYEKLILLLEFVIDNKYKMPIIIPRFIMGTTGVSGMLFMYLLDNNNLNLIIKFYNYEIFNTINTHLIKFLSHKNFNLNIFNLLLDIYIDTNERLLNTSNIPFIFERLNNYINSSNLNSNDKNMTKRLLNEKLFGI
jgi:hypothetical protein